MTYNSTEMLHRRHLNTHSLFQVVDDVINLAFIYDMLLDFSNFR